jgi:hypothetical protein
MQRWGGEEIRGDGWWGWDGSWSAPTATATAATQLPATGREYKKRTVGSARDW